MHYECNAKHFYTKSHFNILSFAQFNNIDVLTEANKETGPEEI
jgi:hypothetical protein